MSSISQFFGGLNGGLNGAAMNGIVLIVLIYGTASISGGHLNPAVTAGLAITRQISPLKLAVYWVAQIGGGCIGAWWVYAINNKDSQKIFGANCLPGSPTTFGYTGSLAIPGCNSCTLPRVDLSGGQIFGIEFLATFTLVFTVFATAVDPRGAAGNAAPFAIGSSLWATATSIGALTGGALNPARTLCPAIVFNCFSVWRATNATDGVEKTSYWYVYILAQLIAGCAAGLIYKFVFLSRPDDGNPGPSSVFKFVARDGLAVKRKLAGANKNVHDVEATPAPAKSAEPTKGPITPRGTKKPTTPKGMVKVIDHSAGNETQVPISQMI